MDNKLSGYDYLLQNLATVRAKNMQFMQNTAQRRAVWYNGVIKKQWFQICGGK